MAAFNNYPASRLYLVQPFICHYTTLGAQAQRKSGIASATGITLRHAWCSGDGNALYVRLCGRKYGQKNQSPTRAASYRNLGWLFCARSRSKRHPKSSNKTGLVEKIASGLNNNTSRSFSVFEYTLAQISSRLQVVIGGGANSSSNVLSGCVHARIDYVAVNIYIWKRAVGGTVRRQPHRTKYCFTNRTLTHRIKGHLRRLTGYERRCSTHSRSLRRGRRLFNSTPILYA